MCFDKRIVEIHIGAVDLVESPNSQTDFPTEGESGDELGDDEEVAVKTEFEDLGVDLQGVAEVSALVEVGKFLFEAPARRDPRRGSKWGRSGHWRRSFKKVGGKLKPLELVEANWRMEESSTS